MNELLVQIVVVSKFLVKVITADDSRPIEGTPTHIWTTQEPEVAAGTKRPVDQLLIPSAFLERGVDPFPEAEGPLVALNENQADVDVAVNRIGGENKIEGPGEREHIRLKVSDTGFTDHECAVGEQDRVPKICRNAVNQEFEFDWAAPEMMALSLVEPEQVRIDEDRFQRKVVTQRVL